MPRQPKTSLLPLGLPRTLPRRIDMMGRDPALIIRLRTTRHSRSIGTQNPDLLTRIHLLGPMSRLPGPLATFALAALLGEEGRDPSVVDEVEGSHEGDCEEEVEKEPEPGAD